MSLVVNFIKNIWFAPAFALIIGLIKAFTPYIPSSHVVLFEDESSGIIWVRNACGRLHRL